MPQEPAQVKTKSTKYLLLGIWTHINRRRRLQLGFLLVVMLASGGAELVSLGAVLPFLAVLSNPNQLWNKPSVKSLASLAGITAPNELILPATLMFVLAALFAMLIRLANHWLNDRLAAAVGSDLSCEAYMRTLYQPYAVHVQRNSATAITGITLHVYRSILALQALLQLATAAIVSSALLIGLLLINWRVALGAATLFGSVYSMLAIGVRKKLKRNSQRIAAASTQQIKALQEGLGSIRDVLLDNNQQSYLEIYRNADLPQRLYQAKNLFLGAFPQYLMEGLGLIFIALLGGGLVLRLGSGEAVIPLLGAIALGAQRLLPALQRVYNGWTSLKGLNSDLEAVLNLLSQPLPPQVNMVEPLNLHESILLEGLHFRYGQDQPEVLRGLSLEIHRGERIGLIGSTGSGKSTTVDLLMGLLAPTAGSVLVDGVDLYDPAHPERLAGWRAAIAHVPQSIYLADSSIAENIAFGVPSQKIDMTRVKQAAEQAQIANFIEGSPGGYQSFVGERGIRLSGGQRQRIGIARALYKQAQVLVFDEATSALDTMTEASVIETIGSLGKSLTVVMVAHRLSTLTNCNRIIKLRDGLVEQILTPEELLLG